MRLSLTPRKQRHPVVRALAGASVTGRRAMHPRRHVLGLRRAAGVRAAIAEADAALFTAIRSRATGADVVPIVRRFSALGENATVWHAVALAGAAVDNQRRGGWLRASGTILIAQVTCTTIKQTIRRRRPVIANLPPLVGTISGLSFPSSHAGSSVAAARVLAPLVGGTWIYGPAGAMALSRVYLGVHFPSDIAVGAVVGSVIGGVGRKAVDDAAAPPEPMPPAAAEQPPHQAGRA
ncbi:MAG: phosphatase PAP2 family protein [Solirubrobacterales bacterium]